MHGCWKIATAPPLAALLAGSAEASAPKVAVFNFERVDASLDGATYGPQPNQQQRLGRGGRGIF
jgi:Skp family chaperone for outer membrane proteins